MESDIRKCHRSGESAGYCVQDSSGCIPEISSSRDGAPQTAYRYDPYRQKEYLLCASSTGFAESGHQNFSHCRSPDNENAPGTLSPHEGKPLPAQDREEKTGALESILLRQNPFPLKTRKFRSLLRCLWFQCQETTHRVLKNREEICPGKEIVVFLRIFQEIV